MRRPAVLLAATALLALSACGTGSSDDDPEAASPSGSSSSAAPASPSTTEPGGTATSEPATSEPAASEPAAPSETAPAATPPAVAAGCEGTSVVDVTTADELQRALDEAVPGQVIRLADGTYEGSFVATAKGTAEQPIVLCGGRAAVLDGGEIDGDYTLHLSGTAFWRVSGLTVTGGQKGVMVDAGVGNLIEGLLVTSMGDEAIHLRSNSTDNAVVGNTIRDTGLRKPKFGEGIYVGSAESNWCQISDCEPDRSDRNLIEGNNVSGTTAEAVDIKEGTTGGTLRGNTFDGAAMVESDSWVDVKGNGWTIEGNTGENTSADGFQVHEVVDGWGQDNVFTGNTASVEGDGYGINVAGPRTIRENTEVRCDNEADGAGSGLSNVDCGSS